MASDAAEPEQRFHRKLMGSERGRAQSLYARGQEVVAEEYNYGEQLTYEWATLRIFAGRDRDDLLAALGLPSETPLEKAIESFATQCGSFEGVKAFADRMGVHFKEEIDWLP